jgi:hypothetical protein
VKRTLTDALFNLDAELHPFANIIRAKSVLRNAVSSARTQLYYCRTTSSTATLMNRVVTRDLKINYCSHRADSDFSLTTVINDRIASCLGAALVNLVIAEPLNVTVLAVLYGRHIGLRFGGKNDSYDVDPCCGNLPLLAASKTSSGPATDGLPLTNKQMIAFVRLNRSTTHYALRDEKEPALKELDKAIAFFPEFDSDRSSRPGSNEKGRI